MKINPDILTTKQVKYNYAPEDAWRMYAPPRTLGTTEENQLAMDSYLQDCGYSSLIAHAIGLGMGINEIAPQFLGYAYLAGLSQNGIIRAGVTTVADEMTKRFIELKGGDKNSDPEGDDGGKIKELTAALDDFGIKDLFNEAAQKCDFEGGCLIYIDMGDDDPQTLQEPLHLDAELFRGKKIRRFTLVEAINLYPGLYNATDPLRPDYFKPTHWLVLGRRIHASRFLYFAPNEVSQLLKPAYNFFGIPAAQIALDYVAHFTKTREAAARLLTKFSLTVFQSDMSAILNGGSTNEFDKRMAYLAQCRDNDMVLAIDKEQENIVKLETPLTGTVEIVRQSLEFVASMFRIPFVKFLGISPGGLNATGDADLTNFYEHISTKQEKIFGGPLKKVINLLQLHLFGDIDKSITFEFCPLMDEDDSKRETTKKMKADRLVSLAQAGIIGEDEARQVLAGDPDSDLSFIDPEEVPEAPEGDIFGGMNPFTDKEDKQEEPAMDEFREEDHPRADNGRFGAGGAVELSGNELGTYEGDIKAFRQKAIQYYKDNLQGKILTREGLGAVRFSNKGLDKTKSFSSNPDKLKTIPALAEIIMTGTIGDEEAPKHQRTDGIVAFIPIMKTIALEGEKREVEVILGRDKQGNLYYDFFLDGDRQKKAKLAEDSIPDYVNIWIK